MKRGTLLGTLFAMLLPLGPAAADVVTDWNTIAIAATAVPPNSILQSRALALTHAAMFDAINAIERRFPAHAVAANAPPGASVDAAGAAAAHGILLWLAPGQRAMLDVALKQTLARVADGQARADGEAVGRFVAEQVAAMRARDGSDATVTFTPVAAPGRWVPTPPLNLAPILTQWGAVTPFIVPNVAATAIDDPPKLSSAAFARDFAEIKSVGARFSTTRTADQTAAAIFWTVQTLVPWNAAARAAAQTRGNTVLENARVFALLNMAAADSQIATFAIKYRLAYWRPVTAIRNAGSLNDPNLVADPAWEPLLGTPPQPDYPSAHASCSGAAEAVLIATFGDKVEVSVTHPPVFGVTRTYRSFSQMAQEVDDARVWGGIHFRTADVAGRELGRRIGEQAVQMFPRAVQ